jgi:hypothetical protein
VIPTMSEKLLGYEVVVKYAGREIPLPLLIGADGVEVDMKTLSKRLQAEDEEQRIRRIVREEMAKFQVAA